MRSKNWCMHCFVNRMRHLKRLHDVDPYHNYEYIWVNEWTNEWGIIHAFWMPWSMGSPSGFRQGGLPSHLDREGLTQCLNRCLVSDSSANIASVANAWVNGPYSYAACCEDRLLLLCDIKVLLLLCLCLSLSSRHIPGPRDVIYAIIPTLFLNFCCAAIPTSCCIFNVKYWKTPTHFFSRYTHIMENDPSRGLYT